MSSALHRQIAEILNLKPAQVERSLDDLSRQIRRHLSGNGEVAVDGLGVFRSVKGLVEFEPDPSVLAYVNSEFEGLKDLNLDPSGAYRVQEVISNPDDVSPTGLEDSPEEDLIEPETEQGPEADGTSEAIPVGEMEPETAMLHEPQSEAARADEPASRVADESKAPEAGETTVPTDVDDTRDAEGDPGWSTHLPRPEETQRRDSVPGMEDTPFDVLPSAGQDEEELAVLRALLGRAANGDSGTPVHPHEETSYDEDDAVEPAPLIASMVEPAVESETAEPDAEAEPDVEAKEEGGLSREGLVDAANEPSEVAGAETSPIPASVWPPDTLFKGHEHHERPPVERTSFRFATEREPRRHRSKLRREDRRKERNALWIGLLAICSAIVLFYAVVYWDTIYVNLLGGPRTERTAGRPESRVEEPLAGEQSVVGQPEAGQPAAGEPDAGEGTGTGESDTPEEQTSEGRIPEPVVESDPPAIPPVIDADPSPGGPQRFSPADGDYAWIVASFPSRGEAEVELRRYLTAGARGEVVAAAVNGRPAYRVAIGRYVSIAEARSSRSELPGFAPVDAWIRNVRGN